jgi:hypothetical protein
MMVGLAGLQFLMCLFFVKDYSLKREDDQQREEAAKAWLKERRGGGGEDVEKGRSEIAAAGATTEVEMDALPTAPE